MVFLIQLFFRSCSSLGKEMGNDYRQGCEQAKDSTEPNSVSVSEVSNDYRFLP